MFTFDITKIDSTKNINNGTFLQTPFWCEFKSRHGWQYRRFLINTSIPPLDTGDGCEKGACDTENKKLSFELSVLNRSFCKGLMSIAYIPLMPKLLYECTPEEVLDKAFDEEGESTITEPVVTAETQAIEFAAFMNELAKALKSFLPKNTIAIRFDPDVVFTTPEERDNFNIGLRMVSLADHLKLKKNKVDIQPPDSTLIDLTSSEEEILNRMHQKWRYNIRLSERKGVTIHRYLGNSLNLSKKIDKFYELTKETNARDGNSSHAKSYYLDLIKSSAEENNLKENEVPVTTDKPLISLYIAEHEGDEIASIMTLFSHDESIYLYGASSNNKRNLMPNHLLQWTAMKDAKAYGSKVYDMYGMPPEGKDENHPMHGLYMFKANFGGKNIHRPGSWDVPLKLVYKPYNTIEKLRAFWYKKVIKKLKGR